MSSLFLPPFATVIDSEKSLPFYRSPSLVPYEEALAYMEKRVEQELTQSNAECIWFLEHPSLYTVGTSIHAHKDTCATLPYPLIQTNRGGRITYHGPGQRIIYVVLNIHNRFKEHGLKAFLFVLEEWIILTLKELGIEGFHHPTNPGVWVMKNKTPHKIAALGIRVRRGVAFHGIAFNIEPDLSAYTSIIPCGISSFGVTSLADLGIKKSLEEIDSLLLPNIKKYLSSKTFIKDASEQFLESSKFGFDFS